VVGCIDFATGRKPPSAPRRTHAVSRCASRQDFAAEDRLRTKLRLRKLSVRRKVVRS
jgi:hypothetical protein